jgi:hypothetical protein
MGSNPIYSTNKNKKTKDNEGHYIDDSIYIDLEVRSTCELSQFDTGSACILGSGYNIGNHICVDKQLII